VAPKKWPTLVGLPQFVSILAAHSIPISTCSHALRWWTPPVVPIVGESHHPPWIVATPCSPDASRSDPRCTHQVIPLPSANVSCAIGGPSHSPPPPSRSPPASLPDLISLSKEGIPIWRPGFRAWVCRWYNPGGGAREGIPHLRRWASRWNSPNQHCSRRSFGLA
jgi:hypothetical protein